METRGATSAHHKRPVVERRFKSECTVKQLFPVRLRNERFAPEAVFHPGDFHFAVIQIERQKATRALHRMAFARLRPQALQRFRLGAHSVRVEAPVQGVMELPTVQANTSQPTRPVQTASLATFRGDALTDLLAGLAANSIGSFVKGFTPLRASVPGLFTTDILTKPGMTNSPDSFSSL